MTLSISLFLALMATINLVGAQENIFNYDNTSQYADYLYESNEFDLAATEYERLVFLSDSVFFKKRLIRAYDLAEKDSLAINRVRDLYPNPAKIPPAISSAYLPVLIKSKAFARTRNFLRQNPMIGKETQLFFESSSYLLNTEWEATLASLQDSSVNALKFKSQYQTIAEKALAENRKSPGLSLAMSTVVPGLGKVYSGRWKQGIFSLLFVGGTAWQSYRGFEEKGAESAFGWIYGTLSFGFYLGNLYGSHRAAKNYNSDVENRYQQKAYKAYHRHKSAFY